MVPAVYVVPVTKVGETFVEVLTTTYPVGAVVAAVKLAVIDPVVCNEEEALAAISVGATHGGGGVKVYVVPVGKLVADEIAEFSVNELLVEVATGNSGVTLK